MKKTVSVTIDESIYQKAHDLGINVSKVCENQLIALINAIESSNGKTTPFLPQVLSAKETEVRLPGFEPGSSTWQIDWTKFTEFCMKGRGRRSALQLVSHAQRWKDNLLEGNLDAIRDLPDTVRPNALKGLSALSKFLGIYGTFMQLFDQYDFKWGGRSNDDVIIDRYSKIQNPDEIWNWIKEVKGELPQLTEFMDYIAVSGLRLGETVNSFNIIGEMHRKGTLLLERSGQNYKGGYFNRDLCSLEHFWIKDNAGKSVFLRASKKAFVTFISEEQINRIGNSAPILNSDQVQNFVRKRGLPLRFSDVREAQGTLMINFLKDVEVDFIHGRITKSVFTRNYFNPALMGDLKAKVFRGIKEIQEKIKV